MDFFEEGFEGCAFGLGDGTRTAGHDFGGGGGVGGLEMRLCRCCGHTVFGCVEVFTRAVRQKE
jgi:hypothetical protein